MRSPSRSSAVRPFPSLPPSLADQLRGVRICLRRFGIMEEDLGIDFAANDAPALITSLLEQCSVCSEGSLPAGVFREFSLGKRLECLLMLAAGWESPALSFPFVCPGCGQELELELTLEEIAQLQRQADATDTIEIELRGQLAVLRKPNGLDQENWARRRFQDQHEAAETMIGTLSVTPIGPEPLTADELRRIDLAMDEADPLVNFRCRVTCAECGHPNEFPIDLCETALDLLRRAQQQLLTIVHQLASHYHWNEKEVFAVPPWRRVEYLDLIAAGSRA